jgi:ABC-2 type transport system ATP-binding protein
MNKDFVIRTRGLTRYFGNKAAVYEVNLEVPRGTVFACVGRNGSGKTTLIRMLLGFLAPTRGEGEILGCNVTSITPELRARIGYVAEDHPLYGWMTVQQIGSFQSGFYSRWDSELFRNIAGHFGLSPKAKVNELSRGQRAGLSLALTLAPDPELLVMDDPALGLDPVARRALVESIIQLTRRPDRTILFTTHQLADVERVADWIGVMDGSILRANCTLETFTDRIVQARLFFSEGLPSEVDIPGLLKARRLPGELRLTYVRGNGAQEAALQRLEAQRMEFLPLSLEDAILSYLGDRGEQTLMMPDTQTHYENTAV